MNKKLSLVFWNRLRLVLVLAITLFFPASEAVGKEFRFSYQESISFNQGMELELSYLSGTVTITGYDGDDLLIDAIKKVNALSINEANRLSENIHIKVEQADNRVSLFTSYTDPSHEQRPLWKRLLGLGKLQSPGTVDYVIAIPQSCNIVIRNSSGQVSISDILGSVKVAGSTLDISLSGIVGPVDIRNSAGYTSGEMLFGPVVVRQPVGRVDLRLVEGDIKVRSIAATILIQQETGSVDLTTRSGNIFLQTGLESTDKYTIQTESGDINLLIPATSSARFEIAAQNGEIATEIPLAIESMGKSALVGDFGFGGTTVALSSVSGDVTVSEF